MSGDARADAVTRRWNEIEPLLDALLELPPEQREAELTNRCDDAHLRALVLDLLALDSGADNAVDRLAREVGAGSGRSIEGQLIGPYRIERALGEGGMGAVFLAARRTAEFTQHVALKLLRAGLFSAAQQEQFRREQQIQARLEHPNIARVHDSGITAGGVPYFAMEYVDGVPVTEHCDRERLGVEARLRLFATICDAVAYAHQNLVVHRDLKPSNIIVDRSGAPKLLDFGIAKLLPGAEGSGERTRTEFRRLTPDYAAPEQFGEGPITTATDVYALGVLLCELLTGTRPGRTADDPAPLRALGRRLSDDAARARGVASAPLRRRLAGDLDAIVSKALQHDPARRYAGAAALQDDIQRHLGGRPIRARPDTWTYRARKFVQRHKVGFAASLLLAVTLIGATAFSMRQAREAREQAQRANEEAGRANAVKAFLQGLFDSAAPGTSTIESADELLARGRERVDRDFANNPDLHAEVLGLVGDLVRRRGRADMAREPLEQGAELARQRFGAADERTLRAEYLLALQAEDAGNFRAGGARLREALDAFNATHPTESEVQVVALTELAILEQRSGDNDAAVALARRATGMAQRILPPEHATSIHALANLGDVLMEAGHYNDAVPLLSEVLAKVRRQYGEQHAEVAIARAALASAEHKLGHYAEAERLLRQAVSIDAVVYSRPNQRVATHLNNLGVELISEGNADEAVAVIEKSLAIYRVIYPDGHPDMATSLGNIAMIRLRQGHYAEAEVAMRDAIVEQTRVRGPDYPDIGFDQNSLARILIPEGKFDEAQTLLEQALADSRKRHGDAHVYAASALIGQAMLAAARGDHAAAVARARESIAMYEQLLPADHTKTTAARLVLGESLLALGRAGEAQSVLSTAATNARASKSPVHVLIAHALADLARADAAIGQADAAAELRRGADAELAQVPAGPNAEAEEVRRILAQPIAAAAISAKN